MIPEVRGSLLTALLLAVALVAGGCDGDGSPERPGPLATSPSISRGGSVAFGVYGEPATLDPYSPLASDLTYALARPVYRSLYRFTPEGEAVPDLVRSLDTSGEVATIDLVRARWSDGRRITTRDVVATIRRARPPSGLASIENVSRRGPRRLVVTGDIVEWPELLARVSFVLPRGSYGDVYSGAFVLRSRVPGLQVVLEPNPVSSSQPYLDRIVVRFTEGLDFLVGLLRDGRLDAAWLPSTVNLSQRLAEVGLAYDEALGWERVYLDLSGADLTRRQLRQLAAAIDRSRIHQGFVRDDGRVADTLHPDPSQDGADGPYAGIFRGAADGGEGDIQLSASIGDELLELIQRLVQVQLDSAGFEVELVNVEARRFYGEWAVEDPIAGALRRAGGAPGWQMLRGPSRAALPLFHVTSVLSWREGVAGLRVNPTLEGPLWNAEAWHVSSPSQ